MKANRLKTCAVGIAATFAVSQVQAGAFQILEHDAAGTGSAHANTAEAGSIASMFANPAAMSFQSGTQFSGVMTPISFSARYNNESATSAVGTPTTGNNGGDAGGKSIAPALFFATNLGANLRFGISLTTRCALNTMTAGSVVILHCAPGLKRLISILRFL